MLTRDQKYTLRLVGNRLGFFVSKDMVNHISNVGFDPSSPIATLLKHIAFNPQPLEIKKMLYPELGGNPRLLLEAGNVVNAAGHLVVGVTPYECGLGEGDHYKDDQGMEMIRVIAEAFKLIPDGEKERVRQYARYKPAIDGIPKQKPTASIDWIFDVFVKNNDVLVLKDALEAFRKNEAWTPRVITRPGMHCNYANPQQALDVFAGKFSALYETSGNNYAKVNLAWQAIVLWVLFCELSGADRMRCAQGFGKLDQPLKRTFNFNYGGGVFPPRLLAVDNLNAGFGFDLDVDIYFGTCPRAVRSEERAREFFRTCVEQKLRACKLMQPTQQSNASWCVIC
jgi:hypothetical protein